MADNDGDSDAARTLRPLQAAACTYRVAFGPRAGQRVLTVQGAMPGEKDFKQALCANIDGFSLHAAVRCGADDRQALEQLCRYIPPGTGQRTRADRRRRTGGAQAQDPLARRDHAPGHVAAGVHAEADSAGATAKAAPHPLSWRAGTLIYNFGQAARPDSAARPPSRRRRPCNPPSAGPTVRTTGRCG